MASQGKKFLQDIIIRLDLWTDATELNCEIVMLHHEYILTYIIFCDTDANSLVKIQNFI